MDVGGTHARFAVLHAPHETLSAPVVVDTQKAASFADLARDALKDHAAIPIRSLIIAAAGPVKNRCVSLTNASHGSAPVRIDGPELIDALNLEQGLLLNDFEGLCLALPTLANGMIQPVGDGIADPLGARVVVGPGTGLGVGALLHVGGRYLPVQSEGGHVSIGPHMLTAHERAMEDFLSGRGLARLHADIAGLADPWSPKAVGDAALAGTDAEAVEAVRQFLGLLGRFAGDMALTFCATGGGFIGGGIVPRLMPLLDETHLRAHFDDKGAYTPYMRTIPLTLIRDPLAALHGLASLAMQPDIFLLDYPARLWRTG